MSAQKLLISTIDERITTLLTFVQKQAKRNPEVVFGDGVERSRDSPQLRAFCRELAADSIVLLKNKDNILPLRPPTQQKSLNIAVIGPNAKDRVISGGGSAALKATYVVTPWEGIKSAAPPGSTVRYHIGCYGKHIPNKIISCLIPPAAHKYLPTLENFLKTPNDQPGWLCTFFNNDKDGDISKPVQSFVLNDTRIKLNDFLPEGLTENWSIKLQGRLTMPTTGIYELGLTVAGKTA